MVEHAERLSPGDGRAHKRGFAAKQDHPAQKGA
jgi:hypothetical protein